jgi:hypothetical protein
MQTEFVGARNARPIAPTTGAFGGGFMSSNVVPLFGAPASVSLQTCWRDRARSEWAAFCKHTPWLRQTPMPCLALEAIEQILASHGSRTSWACFDARAFQAHLAARYPDVGEDGWFMGVSSMAMFFDFLYRRGLVSAGLVQRTYEQCELIDPEPRRERERTERRSRARQRRIEAARARRAARRAEKLAAKNEASDEVGLL